MKRSVSHQCSCPGCHAFLKIEFMTEPLDTGAMHTVDCPVCGMSKMVPGEASRIYAQKDGVWIESRPRSQHPQT